MTWEVLDQRDFDADTQFVHGAGGGCSQCVGLSCGLGDGVGDGHGWGSSKGWGSGGGSGLGTGNGMPVEW